MDAFASFRASPRLRLGVALIVLIFGASVLLDWHDALDREASALRQKSNQVARMQRQEGQQQWADRAAEAARALEAVRAELWRDTSTGRAQAQVQDWLSMLLRRVDAKGVSIRVAEGDAALESRASQPSLLPAGLVPVRARVEVNTDPVVLLTLLSAMAEAEPRVVIDRLSVKPVKTEFGLVFWFQLPQAPESRPPVEGATGPGPGPGAGRVRS
jgi:hypothetical protein